MSLTPVADIQHTVAAHYGVPIRVLYNRELSREAIRARWVGMFLVHEVLGKGPVEIGRRFGRDHSTVGYALKMVANDAALLGDVALLRARLAG